MRGSERAEADELIRLAIAGTRKRIDVPTLVRKHAGSDDRTVVVQILLGSSPLGYGLYINPVDGALEICDPREITRPTITLPLQLEGAFMLLDPTRKEGPMDVYSMGLMPGLNGGQFLAHLRLLHAIFRELKESLRQHAAKGEASP